jgi:hypothetical protein
MYLGACGEIIAKETEKKIDKVLEEFKEESE